uniref:Uncharacterized protein n=1 Tax=Pararge aegeria TaxID=116150 RepID=S4P9S2_9NEOP
MKVNKRIYVILNHHDFPLLILLYIGGALETPFQMALVVIFICVDFHALPISPTASFTKLKCTCLYNLPM